MSKLSLKARIREKLDKNGPMPSKVAIREYPEIKGKCCWLWTGTLGHNDYPQMTFGNKTVKIHRAVGKLKYGKLTVDDIIMHKCDVPYCIRPTHIKKGTTQENTADRDRKGRFVQGKLHYRKGESSNRCKLTEKKVLRIRRLAKKGCSRSDLGVVFGVTPENINRIVRRKTWKHIK